MKMMWRRAFRLAIVFALLTSSAVHSRSISALHRVKRQAADQRIAELQALLALSQLLLEQSDQPSPSGVYGHGYVDPHNPGRRRRDLVYEGSPERRHRTNADDLRPEDRGIWTIN